MFRKYAANNVLSTYCASRCHRGWGCSCKRNRQNCHPPGVYILVNFLEFTSWQNMIQMLGGIPRRVGLSVIPAPLGSRSPAIRPQQEVRGQGDPPAAGSIRQQRVPGCREQKLSWGSSCWCPGQRGGATGLSVHLWTARSRAG